MFAVAMFGPRCTGLTGVEVFAGLGFVLLRLVLALVHVLLEIEGVRQLDHRLVGGHFDVG